MIRPNAERPNMPGYGIATDPVGLLTWKWAEERLRKARRYWLATAGPDRRPHAMPVWGLWLDHAFYFSTGRRSRKARNLAKNDGCVICVEHGADSVVVEGSARRVRAAAQIKRLNEAYKSKYDGGMPGAEPVFVVRPRKAFGLRERDFIKSATRWSF
jgi:nitroimidazol reductase NimA-like FMN-containing flavoprotein (pyridoxamine 5'-phosphate oxidase superfamily)